MRFTWIARRLADVDVRRSGLAFLRTQVLPLATMMCVLFSFRAAVADWYDVPSGSMLPTLRIGDRIVVDKTAYAWRVPFTRWTIAERAIPHRGDVVVFRSPADGTRLVKRVCAVEGDEVMLRDGHLVVNGVTARYAPVDVEDFVHDMPEDMRAVRGWTEDFGSGPHVVLEMLDHGGLGDFPPVRVPEGHVLTLGDNRDRSGDSRAYGFVPLRQVEGRVVRVAFSVDTTSGGPLGVGLRTDRFLHSLD